MNRRVFSRDHPREHTLVLLHHDRLPNPRKVEDHVMLCGHCLDRIEEIAKLAEALRPGVSVTLTSKHRTAGP
jgi:hypothetical protein